MSPSMERASICGNACYVCSGCGPTWLTATNVINFM